jgi:dihydrofolate synthase/folylpolyglutamate synthase
MKYKDTLKWMYQQLPMYQREGKAAYKADLSNTTTLVNYLGNPEKRFKTIHVAGTNGKGSTSHMLASVLQEAGYKVGLYTSPHLKDFRERIKINGEMIPKRRVSSFMKTHQSFFIANQLSFFEMTVGLAFDYFAKEKVAIAIIEVGLGGRLDSTNVIVPEVSVITNIGLDHTQFLGDTLEKIASEKAGIIKNSIPVVVGEATAETLPVFKHIAE